MNACLQQAACAEYTSGIQDAQVKMSRNEVLDMEESALATGDPMELEKLTHLYLQASDPKRRRKDGDADMLDVSGGASSSRDVSQVAVEKDPEFQKKRLVGRFHGTGSSQADATIGSASWCGAPTAGGYSDSPAWDGVRASPRPKQ